MDEKDLQYLASLIVQLHVEIGRLQRRIVATEEDLAKLKPKSKEK